MPKQTIEQMLKWFDPKRGRGVHTERATTGYTNVKMKCDRFGAFRDGRTLREALVKAKRHLQGRERQDKKGKTSG